MAIQRCEMESESAVDPHPLSFSISDVIIRLLKFKRFLALACIISLPLSYAAIRLTVAPLYKSTACIIPFDQSGGVFGNVLKGISNIPLPFEDLGSVSKQLDTYLVVLNSRTLRMELIEKFNLQKLYRQKTIEGTLKALKKTIKIQVTDQNALELTVIDRSRQRASDMANFLIERLNTKVIELNTEKAKANREFLEKRYLEAKEQLAAAEDSMQMFQQSSDVLEIGTQLSATVSLYSRFVNELQWKQYEKSVYQKYLSPDAPQIKVLDTEIRELRKKIAQSRKGSSQRDFLLSLDSLPEQSKKYIRLQRNIMIYNTILEIIMPLYEHARYEEQKSIPVLQVIDSAVPAERKFFPPRTMLAVFCSIAVVFGCSFLIIFAQYLTERPNCLLNKILAALGIRANLAFLRKLR